MNIEIKVDTSKFDKMLSDLPSAMARARRKALMDTGFSSYPSPTDIKSSLAARSAFDYIAVPGQLRRIDRGTEEIGGDDRKRIDKFFEDNQHGQLDMEAWQKFVNGLIAKKIIKMVRAV